MERVFSYRTAAPITLAFTFIAFAALGVGLLASTGGLAGASPPVFIFVTLWAGIPTLYGLRLLLTFAFERIVVSGQAVTWYGWLGQEKATIPLRAIDGVTALGTMYVSHVPVRKYQIGSGKTHIRFTSMLADCDELVRALDAKATVAPEGQATPAKIEGTIKCSYASPLAIVFAGVFIVAGIACIIGLNVSAAGHTLKINEALVPNPTFVQLLPFELIGPAAILAGGWLLCFSLNTSVVASPEGVVYRNWRGREVVRATYDEVMDVKQLSSGRSGLATIITARGNIPIQSGVRNWDAMRARLMALPRVIQSERTTVPPRKINTSAAGVFALLLFLVQIGVFLSFGLRSNSSMSQRANISPVPTGPNWYYDLPSALAAAKSSNRYVLIYFYRTKVFTRPAYVTGVFSTQRFRDSSKDFVFCSIDLDTYPDLVSKYPMPYIPTAYWATPSGTPICYMNGYGEADFWRGQAEAMQRGPEFLRLGQ